MTVAERQARFRSRLRRLASEPERLPSGNYRDVCADCGQLIIARSVADLDAPAPPARPPATRTSSNSAARSARGPSAPSASVRTHAWCCCVRFTAVSATAWPSRVR